MAEIITLEEQRVIGRYSQRTGKAVVNVQPRALAAFAKTAKSRDRDLGLLRRGRLRRGVS